MDFLSIPMLIGNKDEGKESGNCVFCNYNTTKGHQFKGSSTFVGYSRIYRGDTICEYCISFFSNQNYRNKCFIATQNNVLFLKKEEIKEYLLNLNQIDIPYAIYVTQTFKRQGWLGYLNTLNYSKNNFAIITDFVGVVKFAYNEFLNIYKLVKELRDIKISKDEIRTGNFSMHSFKKIYENNLLNTYNEILKFKNTNQLEVICYVI